MSAEISSFEERRLDLQLIPTEATKRLLWYIHGSLEDNVFVLDDKSNPEGSRQPYAQEPIASNPRWHPISQEALTTPAVSSITVQSQELKGVPGYWASETHEHADPNLDFCIYGEEDEDGNRKLLQCCGEDRPLAPVPLLVKSSTQPFVTIHDYITTVHPWVLSLREEILTASTHRSGHDSKLVIDYDCICSVGIKSEGEWAYVQRHLYSKSRPDTPPSDWSSIFGTF